MKEDVMRTFFIKNVVATITGAMLLGLAACDEAEEVAVPPVRSVKTMELATWEGQQTRRLAGVVEARSVSELAFEVSGRVIELSHDIGEQVALGEIIARIDTQPYELTAKSAEATLTEAQARRRDARSKIHAAKNAF